MELIEKFKTNLILNNLLKNDDQLLLAVSGGLDSTALLDFFSRIKNSFNLSLGIVHVHHGIRGEEADDDLEFVRSLSDKYNLPFYFKKVDAIKFARKQRCSLEESARILRYQVYEEFLKENQYSKLATGHTADDQAETILDHFFRGSGILGMRGISILRGPYIRPLLCFSRKELELYVQQNGIDYREDSSNSDLKYRRNRIRKELIPYLKEHFNQNLINTLSHTGEIFEENEQFLRSYANEAYKSLVLIRKKDKIILDIEGFLNYFIIVRKYILFRACEELSIRRNLLNYNKLQRILTVISHRKIGKRVSINQEWQILIDHDGIVINKKKELIAKIKFNVLEEDSLLFQDYEFRWSIFNNSNLIAFERNPKIEFVDFDRTGSQLYLRNFLPGDRFIPLNFTGHKRVADYFSDRKVPHHLRNEIPILESSQGIVWVCGYCLDNRFKVTEHTSHLLKLEMVEVSNVS
ncbi:MAG: tRNA lysidine(34) synthetase TilS [bacterium]